MKVTEVSSPNLNVRPVSARVDHQGHLTLGGLSVMDLAQQFGTPLWVVDEATIRQAAAACQSGLAHYPDAKVLYAGKAFLCLAMCRLAKSLSLGLDVVSDGELYTAVCAGFPPELIYRHGNNKSSGDIESALMAGSVKIVADGRLELEMIALIARKLKVKAPVLLRVTPGVEADTHHYINTGHKDSKFGLPLDEVPEAVQFALSNQDALQLLGLHAHIGSQIHDMAPYLAIVNILADCALTLKRKYSFVMEKLDIGGGLGIAYTESDKPIAIYDWSSAIASRVLSAFQDRQLSLPQLLVEPGRSIVGTAGVTIYQAGYKKSTPGGKEFLAVDGGMGDNPRPITYQANYTACVANRMNDALPDQPVTLVGRYCESGDIIVKEAYLPARSGDLIAVFCTGAYGYSQASNYNRTARPACVLVFDGKAEVIIERETNADLIRQDRVPERLL